MDLKTALLSRLDYINNIPIFGNKLLEKRRRTARKRFEGYRREEMEHLKESAFGTLKKQEQQLNCKHEWEYFDRPKLVLEFIEVHARCTKCRTYKRCTARS